MKIGNSVESAAVSAPSSRTESAEADKSAKGVGGSLAASTQVELSNTAAALRAGATQASADLDVEKVSRISQSIESGNYSVNAEVIADKLIANAQELLSKGQR